MATLPDARTRKGARFKHIILIDGVGAWTDDTEGHLTGSGAASWIGVHESGAAHETVGTRIVNAGLIVPDELSFSTDPKTGRIATESMRFKLLDLDDQLAITFATEGVGKTDDADVLGARIAAGVADLGATITVQGGATIDPAGKHIGIERIGPGRERRALAALPTQQVGYEHAVHPSAGPGEVGALPAVTVSDQPIQFSGRLVTLYRVHKDPDRNAGDYTDYYTWQECEDVLDRVWWGVLRDQGQVSASKIWTLEAFGPGEFVQHERGGNTSGDWIAVTSELTLTDAERKIAVRFSAYDSSSATFFKGSVFNATHDLTATSTAELITEIDAVISDVVAGDNCNVDLAQGDVDLWQDESINQIPDAGIDQNRRFWVKKHKGGLLTSPMYLEMRLAVNEKVWKALGWSPQEQDDSELSPSDVNKCRFRPYANGEAYYTSAIKTPGPGYWQASMTTITPGADWQDDPNARSNGGAKRYHHPAHTAGFVVNKEAQQVLRLHTATHVYLEGQLTVPRWSDSQIDASATDKSRFFAMRVKARLEVDGDAEEVVWVFQGSWIEGTTYGDVSSGTGVNPAIYIDRWLDGRSFGFRNPPGFGQRGPTVDITGNSEEAVVEIVPLNAYAYHLRDNPEYAHSLWLTLMLSTGSGGGYSDHFQALPAPTLTAGDNQPPELAGSSLYWGGDVEIADLGLGIPKDLVADATKIHTAFDSIPGGVGSPLGRCRYSHVGPFGATDMLDSLMRPRALLWGLDGKKYGVWRLQRPSPQEATVTIAEDDLWGEQGDPTSVHPTQVLRVSGQLDAVELEHRGVVDGKPEVFRAQDPGARRRRGELVERISDTGLLPLPWYDSVVAVTGVESWRDAFRQLWSYEMAELLATRHFEVTLRVGPHKAPDLMNGTAVVLSNPWPVDAAGVYGGMTNHTGRVLTTRPRLSDASSLVTIFVFAGQFQQPHYSPVCRLFHVADNLLTAVYYADFLGHGGENSDDGVGWVQPSWAPGTGNAAIAVYQRLGTAYSLVATGRVSSVNTTTRTITFAAALTETGDGILRDRDKLMVLDDRTAQSTATWPSSIYGVVCEDDFTWDGTSKGMKFQ